MSNFYIGTSGYQYKHWDGGWWYPDRIPVANKLEWHMRHFNALEINSSFYAIPKPERVEAWADKMAPEQKLVLKAPQSVTHARRLRLYSTTGVKDGIDLLCYFLDGARGIPEEQRGPLLFQIPRGLGFHGRESIERLTGLLNVVCLGYNMRLALEVRHSSWLHKDVIKVLSCYNAALVEHDHNDLYVPYISTADWHYVRRHGTNGKYSGEYTKEQMIADYARLNMLHKEVYLFYNNDGFAYAPHNAAFMLALARQNVAVSA